MTPKEPTHDPKRCGQGHGEAAHRRRGERPCEACRAARRAYQNRYRAERREHFRELSRTWYAANSDRVSDQRKERRAPFTRIELLQAENEVLARELDRVTAALEASAAALESVRDSKRSLRALEHLAAIRPNRPTINQDEQDNE